MSEVSALILWDVLAFYVQFVSWLVSTVQKLYCAIHTSQIATTEPTYDFQSSMTV